MKDITRLINELGKFLNFWNIFPVIVPGFKVFIDSEKELFIPLKLIEDLHYNSLTQIFKQEGLINNAQSNTGN